MSGRSRQLIVVLLLVSLALLTIGCFGGGGTATTTMTTRASTGGGSTGTLSQDKPLNPVDGLPSEFTDALTKQPIVVLFYVPGNADDKSVLDTVNRLKSSFSQYAFLLYDYKNPDAYGTLAQFLSVDYPPYMVLINGAGVVRSIFKGYVDEGSLNQTLVNLGRQ